MYPDNFHVKKIYNRKIRKMTGINNICTDSGGEVQFIKSVFALTHLPKARDKYNWIQTSENYERICLNK
jgi:hypothetical protein